MIKETKTQQEVITQHKYCDVCGVEIEHSLACTAATCEYCGKDLCDECIGYEEETGEDCRSVWCTVCWVIGGAYRPEIEVLEARAHLLYQEWQDKCKSTYKERVRRRTVRKVKCRKDDPEVAKKVEEMRRKLQRKGKPALDDFIGKKNDKNRTV